MYLCKNVDYNPSRNPPTMKSNRNPGCDHIWQNPTNQIHQIDIHILRIFYFVEIIMNCLKCIVAAYSSNQTDTLFILLYSEIDIIYDHL